MKVANKAMKQSLREVCHKIRQLFSSVGSKYCHVCRLGFIIVCIDRVHNITDVKYKYMLLLVYFIIFDNLALRSRL